MNIVITGSSGMIGTDLFEQLLKKKYNIIGIDKKDNHWSKAVKHKTLRHNLKFPVHTMKDTDLAVLLAANARVYELVEHPELAKENIDILYNSLEMCRKNDINKVIFASSREVYGNKKKSTFNEEDNMIQDCESPYTASKIYGESLIHAYQKCYGIDYIILRYSNVYGRYDDSTRLIHILIQQMKKNKDVHIWGPKKRLDFTYIDDSTNCTLKCISKFNNIKNNIFNVASGKGTTIGDIAIMIKIALKSNSKIIYDESRIGEITNYVADISKAKDILDYEPKVFIVEGIKKSLKWYK